MADYQKIIRAVARNAIDWSIAALIAFVVAVLVVSVYDVTTLHQLEARVAECEK